VVGVGGHAEAEDLGEDGGVAGQRRGEGFEDEHGAPSPRVMPSRSAENGRQAVGETTRMESQARRKPGERGFVATGDGGRTMPERTMWKARPMAWVAGGAGGRDGEHRAGDAEVDGDVAAAGRGHGSGDGERVDAGVAVVELGGLDLFGRAAAGEQPRMMAMSSGA
jgi:hypothetical protein